jgi:hypothetical protein
MFPWSLERPLNSSPIFLRRYLSGFPKIVICEQESVAWSQVLISMW